MDTVSDKAITGILKDRIHDWAERETRALDVVASWESLCDTYHALEFSDQLSDSVRLEEFKWIIREMNKFLTRTSSKLMSAQDIDGMKTVLMKSFNPAGQVKIEGRKSLAYHKLRQRWVIQMLAQLDVMEQEQMELMEGEEYKDGWTGDIVG